MNRGQSLFKNAVILCLLLLFSLQTHGTGEWREWVSRFLLPFSETAKTYKLEKKQREELTKSLHSMSDRELVALDSELKSDSHGIDTIEEMKTLAREEIYTRIAQNERNEISEILAQSLKARLDSVLNNEKTVPHFFEILQDTAEGNPPKAYRNILKEFFFANVDSIMALGPDAEEIRILNGAIYSISVSIRILQETLDRAESAEKNADTFLAAFDAATILPPNRTYRKALKNFFTNNSEKLGKLLSAEQAEVMDSYISKITGLDAQETTAKGLSETPNTKNVWNYLQDIVGKTAGQDRVDGGKLFINFLKTWPQYLNLVDEESGDNLLHLVARHGTRETSRDIGTFLLDAGLELEAQNKRGMTALFLIGVTDMFSPLFDYLKEKGAKVNATDSNGNTILHHFLYKDYPPKDRGRKRKSVPPPILKRPSIPESPPIRKTTRA